MTELSEAFEDLDEWMTGDLDYEDTPDGLQDQHVANAILRRKGALLRELEAKEEVYEAERQRLVAFIERQRANLGDEVKKLDRWLSNWHRAQLGEHGKGPKTIELPSGVLKVSRRPPPDLEVDEAAFMSWARENRPELIRPGAAPPPRPPAPDRAALRKLGEVPKDARPGDTVAVVPGVILVVKDVTFSAMPATFE